MALRGHLCDIIIKRRWRIPAKIGYACKIMTTQICQCLKVKGESTDVYTFLKRNRPFLFKLLLKVTLLPASSSSPAVFCICLSIRNKFWCSWRGVPNIQCDIQNISASQLDSHSTIHLFRRLSNQVAPSPWVGFIALAITGYHGRKKVGTIYCYNA